MENISKAFEWIAVGELVLAFAVALIGIARALLRGPSPHAAYLRRKTIFGRGRVLLSFSLDVEIDGVLPWRKGQPSARGDGQ